MNKSLLIFLTLLSFSFSLKSQVCNGNLGENIFTDGDFGSGSAQISRDFQNIAPGYSFTGRLPPNDGWFTIANSTNAPDVWPSWLRIPDNSDDPNGYMMVVNASNEPGLFYDQTVTGLCENTLYEFSVDIINLIRPNVTGHTAPNITFLLDGQVVTSSGDIPQDAEWHNYGVLFTTDPSTTSVKLSIRNNAPGGIGNDLAIDNISFRTCGDPAMILPRQIESICENGNPIDLNATIVGDQYPNPAVQWQRSLDQGLTWEDIPGATGLTIQHTGLAAGYYYYRYLLAGSPANLLNLKCRIVSNVKVVYVQPKFWNIVDTICEGIDYFHKGELITETGIYSDSLLSSLGCDSVVMLDLTILPEPNIEAIFDINAPTCAENASGEIMISSIQNGNPPYEISMNGMSVGSNIFFPNLPVNQYEFRIVDKFGCEATERVDLSPPNDFSIEIGNDLSIALGDIADIISSASQSVQTYNWQPAEAANCLNCPNISFYPTENTTVILEAISDDGCRTSDSLNIEVFFEKRYFIPSAFSPNNDGINDFFTVYAQFPNVQKVKTFQVFDRWGGLVFENKNFEPNIETEGWNGEYKGKPVGNGIYTYFFELEFLNETSEVIGGDISLFMD